MCFDILFLQVLCDQENLIYDYLLSISRELVVQQIAEPDVW
jgi:hypothetical protein